jgi:hypothetical protein
LLQDPATAADDIEEYVARNASFAERERDEEIDGRRELAMAARLKALTGKYRRIVFVCGLAHWHPLLDLLQDSRLEPALGAALPQMDAGEFRRVILHPLMAIHHLDTFPVFANHYEDYRRNAQQRAAYRETWDWDGVFHQMLETTYRQHFIPAEEEGEQLDRALEDWEAKPDFERMLANICTLRQRKTPDIFSALSVAQSVMSESFSRKLSETFMDIQWVTPATYRDLPILAPSRESTGPGRQNPPPAHGFRAELMYRDGRISDPFYVQSFPGRRGLPMKTIPFNWQWNGAPAPFIPPISEPDDGRESWVPTEDLINALLFQAVRVARNQGGATRRVEPFQGSLLDGIDVKTTLRSAARAEKQIFVRSERRHRLGVSTSDEDIDAFPVVWIFRRMIPNELEWICSADKLKVLSEYVGEAEWDAAGLPYEGYMFTSVAAVTETRTDPDLTKPGYEVNAHTIVGKLSFWPQCSRSRTAEWAIETKLARNPVTPDGDFQDLLAYYRERFGFEPGDYPWHVTLIRMAIPVAKKAVTIVAPDGYVLPRVVHDEAAIRRVEVRVAPLSYFPSEVLRRISRVVFLPVLRREYDPDAEIDYPVFPEHVERYFNEPRDTYRHLIHAKWH